MKKFLALILAAMLIFCMVACSDSKGEDETDEKDAVDQNELDVTSGTFKYDTNDDGDYEIIDYIPSSPKSVELLELPKTTTDGRDIVGIANDAFKAELSIKSVVIPETYTYINDCAFYGCENLEKVTMTDNVVSIGTSAFDGCKKLSELTLSKNIAKICSFTFKDCATLSAISLGDKTLEIADGAFLGCSTLTSVTVASSITTVSKSAFYGCNALAYTVENNAKYIGNAENPYLVLVSAQDLNIESCVINDATQVIANAAFSNCSYLKSVILPDAIKVVSGACFENCDELELNEYENGLYLGSATNDHLLFVSLVNPSVNILKLHADTKIIADEALANCHNLKDISYGRTATEWDGIIKSSTWNNNLGITIFCSDKEITVTVE